MVNKTKVSLKEKALSITIMKGGYNNMENRKRIFSSDYTPRTGDLGKFIVYGGKDEKVSLAAKTVNLMELFGPKTSKDLSLWALQDYADRSSGEIRGHIDLAIDLMDRIKEVYGGGYLFVPNKEIVKVFDESQMYGPVTDEAVQKCFDEKIKVVRIDKPSDVTLEDFLNNGIRPF